MKTEGDKVCESNLKLDILGNCCQSVNKYSLDPVQCEYGFCPFRYPRCCCFISVWQGVQSNLGCNWKETRKRVDVHLYLSTMTFNFIPHLPATECERLS